MASRGMQRKLAAILAADAVGFSRLMEADEEGTLAALKGLREDLIDPIIASHGGRIVKVAGDGMLCEFASVVDAVNCAIAVQAGVAERSAAIEESRRLAFRVGVNLGDVIVDGDDLYGDGVNVAVRLEALAEPGGLCVSSTVHDHLAGKVDAAFEDAGIYEVKNIARPIHVWRWRAKPSTVGEIPSLPDVPSIAVLPFDNLSGDPEQAYFADGIVEDLITGLSKFRWLLVISRHSTFAYKERAVDAKAVARELGVRYVVEGSVRRAGDRVRVAAQLIDALADHHVWAERYDRDLADIFALQDEITETIVGAIEPELVLAERERSSRKPTDSLDAWDCYLRGVHQTHLMTKEGLEAGVRWQRRAVELDPSFAQGHAGLAYALFALVILGYAEDPKTCVAEGYPAARRAVALDERDAHCHYALGRMHLLRHEHDVAIAELETAVALNPNLARAQQGLAQSLLWVGRAEESLAPLDRAIRLSPRDPIAAIYAMNKSVALIMLGRYDEAVDWAERASRLPGAMHWVDAALVAALAQAGRLDEAKAAFARLLEQRPDFSLDLIMRALPAKSPDVLARYVEGLKKAGMPG